MKKRNPFDLLRTEIGAGPMLIEASAGTGKTFTISGLVLRLLLERPELTIERILVTTFTELATAELRGRIRALLQNALAAFRAGTADDEILSALLRQNSDHRAAARRLLAALGNFDEAPIYTIHGFCQRVLAERAFESGTLFDAELVTNQADLLREIAYDFWRRLFYEGSDSAGTLSSLTSGSSSLRGEEPRGVHGGERFAALLALKNKITPEKLIKDIEELTKNPTLRILPEELRSLGEIARDLGGTVAALRGSWATEEKKLRELFTHAAWAKNNSARPEKSLPLLDDLGRCLRDEGGTVEQLACLEAFATRTIRKNVRAGQTEPESAVFEECEQLLVLESEFCIALQAEFFSYARSELHERKLLRNVLSFDDLLTRLDAALAAPGGAELAASIREKYQAALIDEFQDTDPVQYSIFARIYGGSSAPVAFIGDPKQAIYAFRGADVFTYLQAASETPRQRQWTLTTNWRSTRGLIQAVNTIFDRPNPFLIEEIGFSPVTPSPQAEEKLLLIDGKKTPPFHLWLAEEDAELPASVASEVVRLLTSGATIGDADLEPRHLAILTSTNAQASQMQSALRDRGVPSVLYSSGNVFTSHEARELRDVLAAVAQPGYEKFVRAALSTDALGQTAEDLDRFTHDDVAWENELLRFQKHHEIWRDRGFIQMLRQLSAVHGVRRRLLGFPDGARRLTNFLHLIELLHSACVEHRLGMNGLLKWLGQRMQEKFAQREEHELRLESDEHAVRIITVHKSKGLEFDVVFCPFVWSGGIPRRAFHDPAAKNVLTLDLADPESHKPRREEEALAEQLRQFYVALTRARHRCAMVWRTTAKEDKSAPHHLLRSATALPPEITANPEIAVAPLPEATAAMLRAEHEEHITLEPRPFRGVIDHSWGIASFTRLLSGREADPLDESPLLESPRDAEEPAGTLEGMHAFPRGMRAGTCLHEIIEQIDFADLRVAPAVVQERLRAYGMAEYEAAVLENIRTLAALPLAGTGEGFTLADVPNESRIAEMEFSFPINGLTSAKLARVLDLPGATLRLERLHFQLLNGFMNGFIDLSFAHDGRFYFADWKSNWLGPDVRAYHPAATAAEMQRNFYSLQLCIYSVALHRYLLVRKPGYDFDQHFGGAFYIFLRGIEAAEPRNGIYFHRLTRSVVERLSAVFGE